MTFELHSRKSPVVRTNKFPVESDTRTEVPKAWPIELRQQAVDQFDSDITDTEPVDISLDIILAKRFEEDGRLEEAERIYKVLSRYEDSFEILSRWANVLYQLERDEQASEIYHRVLDRVEHQSAELFEVYKNIGNLAVKSQDLDTAEEYFNKAYTIDPESDVLLVNYGTLGIQRFDYELAAEYFKKAVDINQYNDRAWVGLALIHYAKSDHDLAWANALKALDFQPANRTALGLIAQWATDSNQMATVINRTFSYLDIEDQDGDMSLLLVRLLISTGQISLARIEVERAFQFCQDPTEAFQIRSQIDQLSRGTNG